MSFLCWRAVWHLPQNDDTSALSGPDLLSTRRHLEVRQCCGPIRRENEDENPGECVLVYGTLSRLIRSQKNV